MGEQFEACWKCGTASDGSPPPDPEVYEAAEQGESFATDDEAAAFGSDLQCPLCGQTTFAWGTLQSAGDSSYCETDGPLAGCCIPCQARRCVNCGNVQLFV